MDSLLLQKPMAADAAPLFVREHSLEFNPDPLASHDQAAAQVALLRSLGERGYSFVTPTPETCRRMFERPLRGPPTLQDIFGWSAAFHQDELDPYLVELLRQAGALQQAGCHLRSRLRVSTLYGLSFLHSAFPTSSADAVFLGPDSYRFANFLRSQLENTGPVRSIVDVGTGAGVGGLAAAKATGADFLTLTDINPKALQLAAANALHAGVAVDLCLTSGLNGLTGGADLIVANPPYIAGVSGRTYRDGGDLHGARLSLDWAKTGMEQLGPGGRMMLYTGSAILRGGDDRFRRELSAAAIRRGFTIDYHEIDPDVFGAELARPEYEDVERIAAVGAVLTAQA